MKILLIAPCPVLEQRPASMDIPQLTLSQVCQNEQDNPVDFNVDKYVHPFSP